MGDVLAVGLNSVKGGGWALEDLPEARAVAEGGGRVEIIPQVPGRSTMEIIKLERYKL